MKRFTRACRALQYAMAMGSIVTLLASCGSDDEPNEKESSSENNVGTAHQALLGKDGSFTVTAANTVLNQYSRITTNVALGATTVTINNIAELTSPQFGALEPGDLVMLYQAQGATIDSSDTASYGNITSLGNAGRYEFVSVTGIAGNTLTVDASCGGLKYAYDTAGNAQIVRVPQLVNLTINAGGSLVPTAWDGQRGGIVALHVTDTATVNAMGAIDASGLGFRGGATHADNNNFGTSMYRSLLQQDGGEKGEGIAGYQAAYDALGGRYGRGAPANGGGGGNTSNAGGGGGANGKASTGFTAWNGAGVMDSNVSYLAAWQLDPAYTTNGNALTTSLGGGRGGYTLSFNFANPLTQGPGNSAWGGDLRREVGGRGGRPLDNDLVGGYLFFGGGGGAGGYNLSGGAGGGRGGGLVIVLGQFITGTGSILANGANGANSSGSQGPGGGGAGGTILLQTQNLGPSLVISANGGSGGNHTASVMMFEGVGPGGGGSGGYVGTRSPVPAGVTVNGGTNGTTNSPALTGFPPNGATAGAPGLAISTSPAVTCIDITAPNTTIPTTEPNPTNSPTGDFVFASDDATATFECRIDAGPWAVCPANYTTPSLGEGIHTIEARAVDPVGNPDPTPATYTWLVDTSSLVENCTASSSWSKGFGDAAAQTAKATAIDGSNNIVIAGNNAGTVNFGGMPLTSAGSNDIIIAKFDGAGNHLWSKQFGDTMDQMAFGTAIDGAGNVVLAGRIQGTADFGGGALTSAGSYDAIVAKFDANGNHLWSKRFGDPNVQDASATAVDSAGNVVIVGQLQGTVNFGGGPRTSAGVSDIYVAKFNASGNHLWSKNFGDSSIQNASAVAIDGSGNVVITGGFAGSVNFGGTTLTSLGGNDICLAKLDAAGNHLWSKRFGDTTNESGRTLAIDNGGNVVLGGFGQGAIDFGGGALTAGGGNDGFVAKFDANGNHLWSKQFGDASAQVINSTVVDGLGNVIVGGQFAGMIDLGGGPFTSVGNSDAFVAKFDPNGVHIWSQFFGSAGNDLTNAIAIDIADNVVLGGDFSGNLDFGNGPLVNAGSTDAFVAKLVPCVPVPLGGSCTSNGNCGSGFCDPAGNVCACDQNSDCPNGGVCNATLDPNVCTNCGNGTVDAGEGCDDGNFSNGDGCTSSCLSELGQTCTTASACGSGFCVNSVCCQVASCTAQDQCHDVGTCQPGTGLCSNPNKADGASCNDNDACTQTDTCLAGTCTGANPVTCSASDQCHDVGTCDPMTGLCSNPSKADGTACNDNDACTQSDTCQAGTCTGANPVTCSASDQCHDIGTCDPMTGTCSNPNKADGSNCNDNDACTQSDTCQSGTCTGANPITCSASDQCHDVGTCNPITGICSNPSKADGASCNDGDGCTQSDTCLAGACTGSNPVTCSASDQCHDVGTCDPMTGICSNPSKADGSSCNDNDACTQTDTCLSGACTGANPVTCSASDQCHDVGTCDPMTGICSNPSIADGSTCNDNDACTQTDTCQSGACTGANPVICTAATACHDGGTCDPATGICSGPISADGTSCNDGNACTQTDTCQSGSCTGANPITCRASDECEIAGACNSATGACDNTAKPDGTYCSHGICQNGKCTEQCFVDSDCAELFECTRFHQCQPLTIGPLDAGATCACNTIGSSPMPSPIPLLSLVALSALRLRRRRG